MCQRRDQRESARRPHPWPLASLARSCGCECWSPTVRKDFGNACAQSGILCPQGIHYTCAQSFREHSPRRNKDNLLRPFERALIWSSAFANLRRTSGTPRSLPQRRLDRCEQVRCLIRCQSNYSRPFALPFIQIFAVTQVSRQQISLKERIVSTSSPGAPMRSSSRFAQRASARSKRR